MFGGNWTHAAHLNLMRDRGFDPVADFAGPAVRIGRVFSTDFFYHPDQRLVELLQRFGFLALDMETAGLYGVAAEQGTDALSVLTVSDHLIDGRHMSAEQRETGVDAMVRLVLDALTA